MNRVIKRPVFAAIALAALLAACGKSETEREEDAEALAAADLYGVDQIETLDGITYVRAGAMVKHFQDGDIFCYGYRGSDNTCEAIEYASQVNPNSTVVSTYYLQSDGRKQLWSTEIKVKGKFSCSTATEAAFRRAAIFNSIDRRASISTTDYAIPEEQLTNWHQSNIRASSNALGIERCLRYSLTLDGGAPVTGIFVEHSFVGGVKQPERSPVVIHVFEGRALDRLNLRPAA